MCSMKGLGVFIINYLDIVLDVRLNIFIESSFGDNVDFTLKNILEFFFYFKEFKS